MDYEIDFYFDIEAYVKLLRDDKGRKYLLKNMKTDNMEDFEELWPMDLYL